MSLDLPDGLALERVDGALTLVATDGLSMCGDFTRELRRLRPVNVSRELLVRAARVRGCDHPRAVDATAGMGEDSLLLAAAGFDVTLYERDAVIAALLADALERAAAVAELAPVVARMTLVRGDSVAALRALAGADASARPDVVLLDPMFPERRKSASVKKKAQLLQRLQTPEKDEASMLRAAIGARPRKVVVKRPLKGPFLAGVKPAYQIAGKAVRYDVLVPAQL
ncbi:class I SAM-dependent methyltransferase [Parafannyhessea umbonata]|uniref:class I SAM-dependent methyltransferase n=1 Tax=Parafannyhessea umbonata TaxID=604330 RepID=UPI0026EC8992|nr:class I SAM-dependent methyltransferase [Parafannyhessea umbonata]MDD7199535.1 class I SAM-dependent methyltransferase [Parafannyhessea umbonata]MDY4419044.1 class I SAM-dependent methyltransferase [Parafannyhessea umbonata]